MLAERCARAVGISSDGIDSAGDGSTVDPYSLWSESDAVLISYGDSVVAPDEAPLATLRSFVVGHASEFTTVHVLPFSPYSSDDGFSVVDYREVRPELGTWTDLEALGTDVDTMIDLVCNHASAQSEWFRQFVDHEEPGRSYFFTADPSDDLSAVVRSRTHPLLRQVETAGGTRWVWCTFSHDQVDLDWSNPDLLVEMLGIVDLYLRHEARFVRLDAVAFVWKKPGTSCIHLPQTHELVRLLHTLLEVRAPRTLIVTETNVPNVENLTYFGNRNEAHLVYNFTLPPLLVHALRHGRSDRLSAWMMSMPPAPEGCAYFNFVGTHDGIGMRPAEGLLSDDEIDELVEGTTELGGLHGDYLRDGEARPYELNIAPVELFGGGAAAVDRFICAHTIMLGVEGIPAIWIHSLLGTPSDRAAADRSGSRRAINRRRLEAAVLDAELADPASSTARVHARLTRLLAIRGAQPAFHPNATQYTLHMRPELFGFWRQSRDRSQSVFAIHNVTDRPVELEPGRLNLIATDTWTDLLSGTTVDDGRMMRLGPYACAWITNRSEALDAGQLDDGTAGAS